MGTSVCRVGTNTIVLRMNRRIHCYVVLYRDTNASQRKTLELLKMLLKKHILTTHEQTLVTNEYIRIQTQ